MNKYLYSVILAFSCIASALAQSLNRNYVMQALYLDAGGSDSIVSVQYYDGLGRPTQNVAGGANTDGTYLHSHQEYDMSGRATIAWAPVIGSGSPDYIANIRDGSQTTYSDGRAYTETVYDALDRTTFVSTPGEAWSGKGKGQSYRSNLENEVRRYSATNPSGYGFYQPKTLSCVETTNEEGSLVQVFTDYLGRTVLERKRNQSEWLDTYFVYNGLGQLVYILPPMYHTNPGSTSLERYAFQYTYNARGLVATKKIPGCAVVQYEYDRAGRVTRMRDGLLSAANRYRTFEYDNIGRLKRQSISNGVSVEYDEIVNYYDDYGFLGDYPALNLQSIDGAVLGLGYCNAYTGSAPYAISHLTGTLQRASNGEYLLATYVYDEYGRLAKLAEIGLDKKATVTEKTYNFTGDVTEAVTTYYQYDSSSNTLQEKLRSIVSNSYGYPHTRLLKTSVISVSDFAHGLNMSDTIQSLTYNSFGWIVGNDRGGANADMSYMYDNLHGWTRKVTSSGGFEQNLYYEQGSVNPRWDGGISAMSWRDTESDPVKRYEYEYDELRRLVEGEYTDGNKFGESYAYDKNGNITSLQRHGMLNNMAYGPVDNLTVTYDGNQRKSVSDAVTQRMNYTGASDFVDGTNSGTEYLYDTAGNLIQDYNKGLRYSYDLLGHPLRVASLDGRDSIDYVYAADGRRLRITYNNSRRFAPTVTDEYFGDVILRNGTMDKIRFPGGCYAYNATSNSYDCQYNIEDYQGNIRLTVHKDAANNGNQAVVSTNDYYPYGNIHCGGSGYKYSGKYLDRTYGLDLYDFHARQYDAVVPCFTSPDPLAEEFYDVSPYVFCLNNPAIYNDPNGLSPIYDLNGKFLGTDDLGLSGGYRVMDKSNFKQGMSLSDAEYYSVYDIPQEIKDIIEKHFAELLQRPDYDGFVTIEEGIGWAKSHPGALKNPTPDNTLYINTELLDFGNISTADFANEYKITPINLFNASNSYFSLMNSRLMATVYALGRVNMVLLNRQRGLVMIVNDDATDYDWNPGGGKIRDTAIKLNNKKFGIDPNIHGFKAYYYGVGYIK